MHSSARGHRHVSAAWPLASVYTALIVYASLYPFTEWRAQGLSPLAFLTAPWPRYWTFFDLFSNWLGYMPLGFLLALGLRRKRARWPVLWAVLLSALLSLGMEAIQNYLPARVPSQLDLLLNAVGGLSGAGLAWFTYRWGALDHWTRWRTRWFIPHARGALVLLALWPLALLFPSPIPLALGQVLHRIGPVLSTWGLPEGWWLTGEGAYFLWLLSPTQTHMVGVTLAIYCPVILGYSITRSYTRRLMLFTSMVLGAVAVTALSSALSWGPQHSWGWLDQYTVIGLCVGVVLSLLSVPVPCKFCPPLGLFMLCAQVFLINQIEPDGYFAQTLQTWEQGRFIRFHGLAQWLGWLWPYAVIIYFMIRWRRQHHDRRGWMHSQWA